MCVSPITIMRIMPDGTKRAVAVPCGKCQECLQKYRNDWSLRIEQEAQNWSSAYFFTWTYDNDHLPIRRTRICNITGEVYMTLNKIHLQNLLKRFREQYYRKYKKRPKFKYFCCGEYGTKTHRPHYHGIILTDMPLYDVVEFKNLWDCGYTMMQEIKGNKSAVCRYVTKYASKGVLKNSFALRGIIDDEFRMMSKGIGSEFAERLKDNIISQLRSLFPYGIRGNYYGFNKDALDFIYSMKRVCAHGYIYGMPKYWYEFIFYQKKEYICEVKDTRKSARVIIDPITNIEIHPVRTIKQKRYDKNTPFSLAFARFVREKSDEVFDDKFRQIRAQFPTWEDSQIWSYIYRQDLEDKINRCQEAGSKLASFLLTSKF